MKYFYSLVASIMFVSQLFAQEMTESSYVTYFSPELVSSYSGDEYYGILLPSGNNLYAFSGKEVHCYAITNSNSLSLSKSVTIPLVATRARSAVEKGDYIYIAYRSNLMGNVENLVPDIRIGYNSHIEHFSVSDGEAICNNTTLNNFFTSIKITSIDISTVDRAYIFKAYFQNAVYRNTIRFRQNDGTYLTLLNESFNTRQEAIDALRETYSDALGNIVHVNWDAITEDYNYFSSLAFHTPVLGEFDNYISEGKASIDELGEGINTNVYCARLYTDSDNEQISRAVLSKDVPSMSEEGYLSLWLKATTLSEITYIPLLGNEENDILGMKLSPCDGGMTIGVKSNGNEQFSSSIIPAGEWFNYKIHFSSSSVELYYRSKECGNWNILLTMQDGISTVPNKLLTGIESSGAGQMIEVDDLYYHPTEIDNVSYLNGQLIVLRKSDLTVVKTFYSDIKYTGTAIYGNTLFVNGLTGYNIYDISLPENPKLVSWHRTSTYKEYQGLDIFTAYDRVYAFLCNYTQGYTIVDLTDPAHSTIITENRLGTESEPFSHTFNFDVCVKYPYAYTTLATSTAYLGSQDDKRGILVYDLSNLNLITNNYVSLPNSEYYTYKSIGDQMPNRIALYNNFVVVNNSEKGVAIFDISENAGNPKYKGSILKDNDNVVASEVAFDREGDLFVSNMGNGSEKKSIFMYRLTNDTGMSIENLKNDSQERKSVYDIGRKVADVFNPKKLSKGLYIVNGKKIAVK